MTITLNAVTATNGSDVNNYVYNFLEKKCKKVFYCQKLLLYLQHQLILKTINMQIQLTPQESETMFHNALCNGLGYMSGYGLEFDFKKSDYESAKRNLREAAPDSTICYEDVLMQILREGGELTMIDVECDGEYTRSVSLADVHNRVQQTPLRFLTDMINEQDDAETADVMLQTVFFEEIVFG